MFSYNVDKMSTKKVTTSNEEGMYFYVEEILKQMDEVGKMPKKRRQLDEQIIQRINRIMTDYEGTIIAEIDKEYERKTSFGDRLADRLTRFGGSWKFIIIFGVLLAVWVLWNTLPFTHHFDPNPFILLNLFLSFLAGFQAPIIMMSQNRQAEREKREAEIDFAINYKAEREIDDLQDDIARIESKISNLKGLKHDLEEIKQMIQSKSSS